MEFVSGLLKGVVIVSVIMVLMYSIIGSSSNVYEIKKRAPKEMKTRNWEIIRYEGFNYGAWGNHGGKVWYHVRNIDNHSIQYRVYVTIWDGELQYHYGDPEILQRINIESKDLKSDSLKK